MSAVLAAVAVPRPMRRLFTYLVTPDLAPRCRPGVRVTVPFGRNRLTGYLLEISDAPGPVPAAVKPLEAVLDERPVLDAEMLDLTRRAAEFYQVSWGEMIRAALPGMKTVPETRIALTEEGRRAFDEISGALVPAARAGLAANEAARSILERVAGRGSRRRKPVRLETLRKELGAAFRMPALDRLFADGLVTRLDGVTRSGPRGPGDRAARRPAFLEETPQPLPALVPTRAQREAIAAIAALRAAGQFSACLLHGVTGSGKTEVYLASIDAALSEGRTALYLVPEIGLTPLLARRMRARFGDRLALLHSGLTEGERFDAWRAIREGRMDVVLGARSAVFAPLSRLGIVIVDEEHDASYKQGESPRYHGRDLALMRARLAGAVAVLGSATPSMETYDRARRGTYRLLSLPARIGPAGLPRIERVDMRREFEAVGRESILSRRLRAAVGERLQRREQILILLNRRGFSTFVLCRACGAMIECSRCSIPMTLHLRDRRLRCHYCDAMRGVPAACPACRSGALHFGGTGTERLEDILRSEFPAARIGRMDRDTMRGRGTADLLLSRFERREIDLLVGTQMIAKGHDFPNVTLVGVLAADAALGLPDFRSAERTFQLLSQVAGRSGRGASAGEVIIQAYDPEHHAIRAACRHDYAAFAERELAYRRSLRYPPYSALGLILVRERRAEQAEQGARTIAEVLRGLDAAGFEILGPSPAPLQRLRGEYRFQVLVKAPGRKKLQEGLAEMMTELERRRARTDHLVIDVDPMSTL